MQSADVPLGENLALDDRSPSTLIEAGNTKRRAELSWKDRARAIFFYLHPALGKRDLRLTAKTFDLNSHTLNSWMTNKRVIPKWVPLVEDMEALDILESLPSATRQELLSTSASLGVVNYHSKVDLHRFQKYRHVNHHLNPPEDSHSTHHHHHHQTMMLDAHPNVEHPFLTPSTTSPGGSGSTHDFTSGPLEGTTESLQHHNVSSSLSFNAVGSVPHSSHVKANSKRLALDETKTLGRNRLYQEQEEFIAQTIRQAFESGDPLTKHDLRSTLLMNTPPHVQPFYQACCDPQSKSFPNYLNKFISRSLERLRFVQKKKVIVEKVPHDWRQRVENHVMNITERMKKAQVEAFVAIDEIFIRFHDDSSSSSSATNGSSQGIVEHHDASTSEEEPSLAANGESPSAGSPLGCIVILCLDLVSNQFLPPVVVFTGGPVFSEDEKEIWKHTFLAGGATVIESNTPWISGHTTITTLNHIRNFFPTKRIGIMMDTSPSHVVPEVAQWANDVNKAGAYPIMLLDYIELTLSSVYNPIHASFENVAKQIIYSKIAQYKKALVLDLTATSCSTDRCPMSREKLVATLEETCLDMTQGSKNTQAIAKSFRACGLDPWHPDHLAFEAHLDSISVNLIYERYLSGQQFMELS